MAFLPPEIYYRTVATHFAAAEALIEDPAGRVLLVKATYRPDWTLPGGMVDDGEDPRTACAREAAEELSVAVTPGRLLAVDWVPAEGHRPRPLSVYVFDGGVLDAGAGVTLPPDELEGYRFTTAGHAGTVMTAANHARLQAARAARHGGTARYCVRGQPQLDQSSSASPEHGSSASAARFRRGIR
ncbi:NUDIX hydrolase [Actinoplanes sp. N902-109]|uniref:NUDIX domain-containing protein n=1 Tax=Actinoplanes sp. (strain N902-109) TaxID=649831 RepID=UPI0003294EAD|nr:NUDIX hydrolase [Actinoplanes sp. N902-109]AGL16654.1 NUDIX hydrolase [Actinoplanes sp. N902-109]